MQTKDYSEVLEWAQHIVAHPGLSSPFLKTVAETVLELLPSQTIAETGFDFDTHHLAGATTRDGDEVVMLWQDVDETEQIICDEASWAPQFLTPNGKRYELHEVSESDHPETLTTEQDYKDAPLGTIVADNGAVPSVKWKPRTWSTSLNSPCPDGKMAGFSRKVLRWGWSK